jgi:DNA-binding winged helix-turn-helix (wHTH) protein/Tol biopolymer transport system component
MMEGKSFIFRFSDVEVREREFEIRKAGEVLPVEPKAFRVLLILLRNPQKLLSKEELLTAVWGDTAVSENSLARSIALLRRLLGDEARDPRYIETITTVGYRWLCPVEQKEDCKAVSTRTGFAAGKLHEAAQTETAATVNAEDLPRIAGKLRWGWLSVAAVVVVALLAGGFWYLRLPRPPPRITAYTQLTHDGRSKWVGGTDGSRLYFTQYSPGQISQISVNGGEIAVLPVEIPAIDVFLLDISPDGSNALVGTAEQNHVQNGIWIVPVLGGAAKRLVDGDGGKFSPDGRSVVYSNLDGEIFTVHIDGSDKRKLATVGARAFGFRWSPDGKVIRFSRHDGGLWEMSPDGAGVHRLLPGWKEGVPCCGQWTHDGGLFLFLASGQIWALDERRSLFRQPSAGPLQLTSGPLRWGRLIPGRDEKTIFVDGATPRGELSRIDLKTGSIQPFLGGISAEFVSFSPDGKSVAYVTFPEAILWRANLDGSNRMQLTQPPDHVSNPRWSPDSKEIVFAAETPNLHSSIRRISAVDGTPLWFMSEESADMRDPNWSPDGRKVLYAESIGYGIKTRKRDLRIVDLGTREVSIVSGTDGMSWPRWSPDARYIAALRGATGDLYLFDFATQQWRTLPSGGDVEFPSFTRDSRFLYVLRFGRDQGVFRVPVAGGKAERVVNMNDWHLTGMFGFSMSLDPTDAPLVLRDTGSDDIYALTLEVK